MISFAEKLRDLRTERNLSQTQLAKELKVSQKSVSNWETGIRQPDFQTLELICKYFEVSSDYLLGLTD